MVRPTARATRTLADLIWPEVVGPLVTATDVPDSLSEDRCPQCGKPVGHYEDREIRVRWCGFPEAHYWDWRLKVPKLTMRP
ncbi:MAG: hypothetical protein ABSB97_07805 [Thermoplasmata archaeon]